MMLKRKVTTDLIKWKENGARKPLVLYGARQVGKTFVIQDFAKNHYQNFLKVDFERNRVAKEIFKRTLDPKEIVRSLQILFDVKIEEKKTLIFFDEVQRCPDALNSIKFFAEDIENGTSHYHLICAGSLLGISYRLNLDDDVKQNELENATYPVGKDQQLLVYPLDFEEFLWANNKQFLAALIKDCFAKNTQLDQVPHLEALHLYRQYLIVGGMPEAVSAFLQEKDYRQVQQDILNGYHNDIVRYIKYEKDKIKTRAVFSSIPSQVAQENKKFIYTKIKVEARGRNYRGAVQWLTEAKIALSCVKTQIGSEPHPVSEDPSSFKLYLNDVGLLSRVLGVTIANFDEFEHKFHGAVTENYVACALQTRLQLLDEKLHYWKASEDSRSAEIDCLITTQQGSIPVEVTSSFNIHSKSLNVYINIFKPKLAYRLSQKTFGYAPGKKIKSIPLYAVFCLSATL